MRRSTRSLARYGDHRLNIHSSSSPSSELPVNAIRGGKIPRSDDLIAARHCERFHHGATSEREIYVRYYYYFYYVSYRDGRAAAKRNKEGKNFRTAELKKKREGERKRNAACERINGVSLSGDSRGLTLWLIN